MFHWASQPSLINRCKPTVITLRDSVFFTTVYVFHVILQKIATIFLKSTNLFVFTVDAESVLFERGKELLNMKYMKFAN
jgi:hypothetical protein